MTCNGATDSGHDKSGRALRDHGHELGRGRGHGAGAPFLRDPLGGGQQQWIGAPRRSQVNCCSAPPGVQCIASPHGPKGKAGAKETARSSAK